MKKIHSAEQLGQAMSRAVQAHQTGNLEKARKGYESAIRYSPDDAQIRYLLGLLYGQQGFSLKAKPELSRAVKLAPDNPEYLNHYGLALVECGEHDKAVEYLRQSVKLDPSNPVALNNLGLALKRQGNYDESETALRQALKVDPDFIDAMNNLGNLYEYLSRRKEAIEIYKRALKVNPGHIIVAANLTALLPIQSHINQLNHILEEILASRPADYDALVVLGKIELIQQGHDKAIDIFSNILNKHPSDISLLKLRAKAYMQIGETDKAERDIKQARKIVPDDSGLLIQQARIGKIEDRERIRNEIERFIESGRLPDVEITKLTFVLAKLYEQSSNLGKAFALYEQANAMQRNSYEYDVQDDINFFESLTDYYRDNEIKVSKELNQAATPVFIVGMPRSGTSLVEQILDSHSQVKGMGELPIIKQAIVNTFKLDNIREYPQRLLEASQADLDEVRRFYIEESIFDPEGQAYQTDKMPFNFMHIGIIRQIFPDSPIILCQRQMQAIAYSIYRIQFEGEFSFAYSQREIALYCKAYERLVNFWLDKFPGQIFSVEYEELVTNPEETVKGMLDYCGLEWEEQCLDFHRSSRPVITASIDQVRQPIYTHAIDSWKQSEPYLGEMLSMM